jgi:hypothetical protein
VIFLYSVPRLMGRQTNSQKQQIFPKKVRIY